VIDNHASGTDRTAELYIRLYRTVAVTTQPGASVTQKKPHCLHTIAVGGYPRECAVRLYIYISPQILAQISGSQTVRDGGQNQTRRGGDDFQTLYDGTKFQTKCDGTKFKAVDGGQLLLQTSSHGNDFAHAPNRDAHLGFQIPTRIGISLTHQMAAHQRPVGAKNPNLLMLNENAH